MSQSNSNNTTLYGGQAVIEGVMFSGKHVNVTAVRRKNNEITFYEVPKPTKDVLRPLKRIPLLRGLVAIFDSTAKGASHLNFSTEVYAEEEGVVEDNKKSSISGNLTLILGVAVIGVLSFIFGKVIFTVTPAIIEQLLFKHLFTNQVLHNIIEGVIKIIFLVGYIYAISFTPIIKRLFQYHGAEHKVITCHEAGLELTVPNVQKFNTLHYRCGSSFMVLTVIIGVIIYSFVPYEGMWDRILKRLIYLPLVICVSYEVLRLTNSFRDTPVLRYLGYPGLWLQKLTTREPEDDQVEVSIASFNRMRQLDDEYARENSIK